MRKWFADYELAISQSSEVLSWFTALYTFTQLGCTCNYSDIADLHTLEFTVIHALRFSVFISGILATDLSQSHFHFKSHMKSSLHSLIHFLLFLLQLPIPKTRLNSIPLIPSSYLGRLASRNSTLHFLFSTVLYCWTLHYTYFEQSTQKTQHLLLRRRVYWSIT
jgi:hypothetical protein